MKKLILIALACLFVLGCDEETVVEDVETCGNGTVLIYEKTKIEYFPDVNSVRREKIKTVELEDGTVITIRGKEEE